MADLLSSIEHKLIEIKESLSATDDNCFQYYFVNDDDLPLLKAKINEIPKDKFNDLNLSKNISTVETELEFNTLINSKFTFIDGLNVSDKTSTGLQFRNILIKGSEHNASYKLHQDFNNYGEKFMFNILYYYNIDNCNLEECGTGIVFIDKKGKRRYEILPVYPGLIIVLRDKCMFHHTPKIKPNNDQKPIIRTLIRKYVGFNRYENDKNTLLQSITPEYLDKTIIDKKIKEIEKQMKEYEDEYNSNIEDYQYEYNENIKWYMKEIKKLNKQYENANKTAREENQFNQEEIREEIYRLSKSKIKYSKYKNKYNQLKKSINLI